MTEKRRLLFVDDQPEILDGLRDLLRRQRHEWDMTFVCGPHEAIAELERRSFDVVVSDMRMPGLDGAGLLAHVQERQPQAVRIVLSGHAELEAALRAVPVAHLFLAKPCDPDELRDVIGRACELQRMLSDDGLRRAATGPGGLPSAPAIYERLTRALAIPTTSLDEVAAILSTDVAMCAKVLQLVNSAFFGLGRRITSLTEAVAYLGLATIRTVALSASAFEIFTGAQGEHEAAALRRLQEHSTLVARIAARIVADPARSDGAFMAGMLHDIGKLVLAAHERDYLIEAIAHAASNGTSLHEAELALRGTTHAEIGAYLLGLWGLPFEVVEAVALHHHAEPRLTEPLGILGAVQAANLLAVELHPPEREPTELRALAAVEADRLDRWRTVAREIAGPGLGEALAA